MKSENDISDEELKTVSDKLLKRNKHINREFANFSRLDMFSDDFMEDGRGDLQFEEREAL